MAMIQRRTFGKLGNRAAPRLAAGLDAVLVLPERSAGCLLENISRKGCRLHLSEPPRIGVTVLVRVERIEALGTVAWVRGLSCGVSFATPLPVEAVERVRWAVEHALDNEKSKLSSATAVWR
jgi:PilZ domain